MGPFWDYGLSEPPGDRPSPRGGGRRELAVQRARELTAQVERGEIVSQWAMAAWIGQAMTIMRELTRDA